MSIASFWRGKILPNWLKLIPWAGMAAISGALMLANGRIDTLEAELQRAGSECNTRVADGVAEAEKVARQAMASSVRQERLRWEQLLIRSRDAAERAEAERQSASDRAASLVSEIDAIYRRDGDASVWRDTALPAAIADRLQQ